MRPIMSREEKAKLLGIPVRDFDKLQAEFATAFNRPAPAKAQTKRSRSKGRIIKPPERGSVQDAASILGKHPRTVRSMASRGKIPGAAKIEGTWTFNLETLRTFVSSKEREQWQGAKHQRVVFGGAKCSGAGFKPAVATSNGHYGQTIQGLLQAAAKSTTPAQ
jgi:hypothetical protein